MLPVLLSLSLVGSPAASTVDSLAPSVRVLVFSLTKGFRHDSIPEAKAAVMKICAGEGWSVSFTEDSSWFTPEILKHYDTVMFLQTTGDVLNTEQEKALQGFIRAGGGYVGVHAACDTEYEWPWYELLVGTYFLSHPEIQRATIHIERRDHPTMKHLPKEWTRTDEWYDFRKNPRSRVTVLASVDESTYVGGKMGKDHPITWCQEFDGGRSFYTALGHTKESYSEPEFVQMLAEAIRWTAGKS